MTAENMSWFSISNEYKENHAHISVSLDFITKEIGRKDKGTLPQKIRFQAP